MVSWDAFVRAVVRSVEEAREFWSFFCDSAKRMGGVREYFQKCADEKMDEMEAAYREYASHCGAGALTLEERR
jgi:anaerobic selenocysteine-containing dehydrogenase